MVGTDVKISELSDLRSVIAVVCIYTHIRMTVCTDECRDEYGKIAWVSLIYYCSRWCCLSDVR
jgi:hypothetical protein